MTTNGNDKEINFEAMLREHVKNTGAVSLAAGCDRFDPETASAYLERALGKIQMTAYEEHLASCALCRYDLIELSRLIPAEQIPLEKKIVADDWRAVFHEWFTGWRLGAITGLGVVTAALILVFMNSRVIERQNTAPMVAAARNEAPPQITSTEPQMKAQASPAAETKTNQNTPTVAIGDAPPVKPLPTIAPLAEADRKAITELSQKSVEGLPVPPPPVPPASVAGAARDEVASVQSPRTDQWQRSQAPARGPAANQIQTDGIQQQKPAVKNEEAQERAATAPAESKASAREYESAGRARTEKMKEKTAEIAKDKGLMAAKSYTPVERKIGDKVFRLENGIWIDSQIYHDARLPIIRITFESESYKRILQEIPSLKPYFELKLVSVVWQGKIYEVRK